MRPLRSSPPTLLKRRLKMIKQPAKILILRSKFEIVDKVDFMVGVVEEFLNNKFVVKDLNLDNNQGVPIRHRR